MAEVTGVMFDEFVQSGLINDADVTVKSALFNEWDYKGKSKNTLALQLIVTDSEGVDHEEQLSAGDLKIFRPSPDGKNPAKTGVKLVPVGNQTKLNINTNCAAFMMSLMNADTRGELAAKLRAGDDISVMNGLKFHLIRKEQPKRPGIVNPESEAAAGQEDRGPRTHPLVDKIIAYPWESGGATASAPAKVTAAAVQAAVAPAVNGEVSDIAANTLLRIVLTAGGSIKKTAIPAKVFADDELKAGPLPTKNAVLGLVANEGFLASDALANLGLKYDKAAGTVSMAG